MRRNVAGQNVALQMNDRTTGAPLTSAVSVFVTVDNGTQNAGGGTTTHKGNGAWNYAPTAAETNGAHVAFTATHATGVHQTINVYPLAYDASGQIGPLAASSVTATQAPNLDAAVSSRASGAALTSHDTDIKNRLPAALVSGRMDSSVGAMAANVLTDTAINAGAITAAKIAAAAITVTQAPNLDAAVSSRATQAQILSDATPFAGANVNATVSSRASSAELTTHDGAIKALLPAALVGGRMDASVGAMAANTLTATAIADGALTNAKVPHLLVLQDYIERLRKSHIGRGETFYVDPVNGNDTTGNGSRATPWATIQKAHNDGVVTGRHDVIMLIAGGTVGQTVLDERPTISKRYVMIRGPGRDFAVIPTTNGDTFTVSGEGCSLENFQIRTSGAGSGAAVVITADNVKLQELFIDLARTDGVQINGATWTRVVDCNFQNTGQSAASAAIDVFGGSQYTIIRGNRFIDNVGDGIKIRSPATDLTVIRENVITRCTQQGIDIQAGTGAVVAQNVLANNTGGDIVDAGTNTDLQNNEQWAHLLQTYEGARTLRDYLRLSAGPAFQKSAGGGTTSLTFRDAADSKNRIQATVDTNGNRTAVTLDAT